jgi:hypothetical protein
MPTLPDTLSGRALALRLGFWSACTVAALFVLYTVLFIAIAATAPLFRWTDLAAYVAFTQDFPQGLQIAARTAMLLFGPALVVLLASLAELTPPARALLARLAVYFGVAFAVLSGACYFVQISAVRVALAQGSLAGLEQVVQANPYSAWAAANMLGFTLFLGLASLCVAPAIPGCGAARVARVAWIANGVCCLLGGVGYVLDIPVLVFVTITLGMGGAVLVASVALAVHFRGALRAA